jgi:uncharacterized protein
VDAADDHGNTPLWRAVMDSRGRGEIISILRSKGADPHLANKSGISPVGLASSIANHDVSRYFADAAKSASSDAV